MGLTLVTGASGFVGSHLVHEMRKRGLPFRGVSRQKKCGLMTIPSYGTEMDWGNYLADVDVIVHLAARVHVMREIATEPLAEFRAANVEATLNLARQAAQVGVKRFVFVSTIKVNGESTAPGKPFTSHDPPNPQDAYALSKAEAEAALIEIGRETNMQIVIIRSPLVYGPGVRGNFMVLMKWAKVGFPLLFSKVENKRSLLYVKNLCDLLIVVQNHPAAANRLFLASDPEPVSTHHMTLVLAAAFGNKPIVVPIPAWLLRTTLTLLGQTSTASRLLGDLVVDQGATTELLGWRPAYSASHALNETAASHNPLDNDAEGEKIAPSHRKNRDL